MRGGSSSRRLAPTMRTHISGLALILILILAVACGLVGPKSSEKAAVGSGTKQVSTPAQTSATLQKLRAASPGSTSGYSRERFAHWSKASDFGWDAPQASCDVREAALIRYGKDVKVGKGCKVTSGEWPDPYTGNTYSDPKDLEVDHVVPLANAWRSGASSWNDKQRERYANDPEVLLSKTTLIRKKVTRAQRLGSLPTNPSGAITLSAGYRSRPGTTLASTSRRRRR